MSVNLVDLIKDQLDSSFVSNAASKLGESESGISKAISGLIPFVIGGLANNATKPDLLDNLKQVSSSGVLNTLFEKALDNSSIASVLQIIFGDKINGVVDSVANFSGIGNHSTGSLLNLVTGAALGIIGKYTSDHGINTAGVTSLLEEQKGLLSSALPAGLSLTSTGVGNGFSSSDSSRSTSYHESDHYHDSFEKEEGGDSIWKWLLPLLLLALAAWFLWKQCNRN